jgi:SHS2 domain-containing protein
MRSLRFEDRRCVGIIMQFSDQRPELGVPYETFEHEADIGIRGFGRTIEEAFGNAAAAMYSVMVRIDAVKPAQGKTVLADAPDAELLLVEWLNALLSLSDIERMVFSKFEVKINGTSLKGTAWGEPLDRVSHEPKVEIKGATYHMLQVKKEKDRFVAQCVVDV